MKASPLARSSALSDHAGLGAVLDALSGKIDGDLMQDLNRKVDIEGRAPQAVARDALARMELIDAGAVDAGEPLLIAASSDVSDGAAARPRSALRGMLSQVRISRSPRRPSPLDMVSAGSARLALVSSEAFFDLSGAAPVRDDRFEAVAAVDQNLVHVVVKLVGGPTNVGAVETFVTGAEGSSSHKVGTMLKDGFALSAELKPTEADSTNALLSSLGDGAEAALVIAPEGDRTLVDAMTTGDYRLVPVLRWSDGPKSGQVSVHAANPHRRGNLFRAVFGDRNTGRSACPCRPCGSERRRYRR